MASLDDEKLIHLTTPILKYIWPDSEQLNRRLRRAILKEESVSAGTTYSSVGGWQSNEDFQSWAGEAGRTIVQQVAEMVQHATHEIHSTYRGQVERNTWSISCMGQREPQGRLPPQPPPPGLDLVGRLHRRQRQRQGRARHRAACWHS